MRVCLGMSDSFQAHQAPLSLGFSRQEYWSGLPLPSPGIFPTRDHTQVSCTADRFFTVWATREAFAVAHYKDYLPIGQALC